MRKKRNYKQYQENNKQKLRNTGSCNRYSRKAQHGSD